MRLFAPAKVNLALHVTGRRGDGYHLLDSLVVFAGVGDWLTLAPASELSLSVSGPRMAGVPVDGRNLVWRAARTLSADRGAAMILEKHLPPAGGIGGGSADAAAALRGLAELWGCAIPAETATLGADLPVCLRGTPCRMRGIGEVLDDVPPLPDAWLVLVNPGVEVTTASVFQALGRCDNPGLAAPHWTDFDSLLDWLHTTRNDLEEPARNLAPEIGDVLAALTATQDCVLARMSGSGGTCFGLFESEAAARNAAAIIARAHPRWWVAPAPILTASV